MNCTKDADCPEVKDVLNITIPQTCANVNIKTYPTAPSYVDLAFL